MQQVSRRVQQTTAAGAAALRGDNCYTHSHLQQQDLCSQCWYVGLNFTDARAVLTSEKCDPHLTEKRYFSKVNLCA